MIRCPFLQLHSQQEYDTIEPTNQKDKRRRSYDAHSQTPTQTGRLPDAGRICSPFGLYHDLARTN